MGEIRRAIPGEDSGDVICRRPTILKNIETKIPRSIHIRMKLPTSAERKESKEVKIIVDKRTRDTEDADHARNKFNMRWFIGIILIKLHHEFKRPILKRRIRRPNNHRVPTPPSVPKGRELVTKS